MRILTWPLGMIGGLLVIGLVFVVADSSGPNHQTDWVILADFR